MTPAKKKYKLKKSLGNPLVAAAIPGLVRETTPLINKMLNVVLIAGGGTVLFFLGRKFILDARRAEVLRELGNSLEGQQAVAINEAMGYFSTDEDLILQTAEQIKDWEGVQAAYKKLYNKDIVADLQSVRGLDAQELQEFLKIIHQGAKAKDFETKVKENKPTGTQDISKDLPGKTAKDLTGAFVESASAVNIRTSGQLKKPTIPGTFIGSNIIKTAPANRILGTLTGEQKLDAENNLIFLQVNGFMRDKSDSKKIDRKKFWVAKSQVNALTLSGKTYQNEYKGKPEKVFILDYTTALGVVPAMNRTTIYITTGDAKLLTPQLRDYKSVEKNTAIGIPLNDEIIDASGNHFVKFMSPQASVLFIDKTKVKAA